MMEENGKKKYKITFFGNFLGQPLFDNCHAWDEQFMQVPA